jgi:hypothetical protein
MTTRNDLPPRVANDTGVDMTLDICHLKVNHTYQRAVNLKLVKDIADNFNPALLTRIVVNYREGDYWIIDGQQRVMAIREYQPNYMINAVVHHLLTVEEETKLYLELNVRRKALSQFDQWKAREAARDPLVMLILDLLAANDITVTHSHTTSRGLKAIETVLVWADKNWEALKIAMEIIGQLHMPSTIPAPLIAGLAQTEHWLNQQKPAQSLLHARTRKMTHAEHLVNLTFPVIQSNILSYLTMRKGAGGGGSRQGVLAAVAIIELCNKGLTHSKNRIKSIPLEKQNG